MSWNEPGNGNDSGNGQDPWRGGGRKSDGPPDLDELFRKFKRKVTGGGGKRSGGSNKFSGAATFFGFSFLFIALFALWIISGIYIVSPPESGVVLRFGKYVRTVDPGPHWIPRFIESRYLVNVQQVDSFEYKAEMLTVDENIVSVQLSVQYRRAEPRKYLFNVVNPIASLQQATASALRQVVGNTTLDSILTTGRAEVRNKVAAQLVEILDQYQTGLEVVDVNLQPAKPPEAVTAAFDDAIKAREDEQRYINQSHAYSNKVGAIVQGKVKRLLQEAEAQRLQFIAAAKGETAGYLALLPQYKRAPSVTRERMYLETVEFILSNSSKVIVDIKSGNNLVYLPLDKILEKQGASGKPSDKLTSDITQTSSADNAGSKESRASYSDYNQAGGYRWGQ